MKNPHLIRRAVDHVTRNRYRYVTLAFAFLLCKCGVEKVGGWEASKLECNTTNLPAEALPGVGPLRIAFLTDLHNSPAQFNKVVEVLRHKKPDLIIFGGDLVNADQRFRRTRWAVNSFRELTGIAPTFAILGNHDYEKLEQVERVLSTAGVKLLRNEAINWQTPSGTRLCIVGLGDWNEGDEAPQRCLLKSGEDTTPVLLLSHDPESRWGLRDYDWDIMLSGHNHGGQIGIPFTDVYLSFRSSMPAGLYSFEGNRQVFVSRGVGSVMGMRFFCPPELNIIELGTSPVRRTELPQSQP